MNAQYSDTDKLNGLSCMPTIRGSSPQEFAIATNYIVLLCLCGSPADLIKCLNFSAPVPMLKLSNMLT